MKKIAAFLFALILMTTAAASAEIPAEDGLLRVAVLYDISTMDVAQTTDNYMVRELHRL